MAEKKMINSPFVSQGICATKQTGFDTYYKSIEIVDYAEKIGDGEHDFVIKKKVNVTETPIQEVIDQDKDSVGVDNIIKQVLRTGDTSLLPVDKGECQVDLVGAPENLMQLKEMGQNAENAFKGLPEELTQGMDMKAFVNNMTQEQFDAFINAVAERNKKGEVKDNE